MNSIRPSSGMDKNSRSRRLEIDFGEQQELAHRVKRLSEDLEESPLATPDRESISLRGVGLRVETPRGKPQSYMSLDILEQLNGPASATIRISDGTPKTDASYNLLPDFDSWEEWQAGMTSPSRVIDNGDLINLLDGQVPVENVFDALADRIPSGLEVAHMLAHAVKKSARTRTRKKQYSTAEVILGGNDYMGGVETVFSTRQVNGRTRYGLFVAAAHLTSFGMVEKQYSYEALFSTRTLQEAGGEVIFSAHDTIPAGRLDAFAQRDQHRNYPVDSLNQALSRIRKKYKV